MTGPADVVIVGGGVIGLSIAYVLAGDGARMTLIDSGPTGRQASWAGAGIISPGGDRPSPLAVAQMRTLSARMHAEWAEALREETAIDNGYRRCGGVDIALSEADEHDLESNAGRWRDEGIAFERLPARDLQRVEPTLGPAVRLAYWLPDVAQIRNPRHLRALDAAVRRRGGTVREGLPAQGFATRGDRVEAVETPEGPIACDRLVIAAGAWSGLLLEGLGLDVPTRPVRGQIVLLDAGRDGPSRIVEHGKRYLVPRGDGRVLVGSTEEDAGFAAETTEGGIAAILAMARTICPALEAARVERAWAGLRPGSVDTRPYLGPAPGFSNVLVATGHQRAGLGLSTGTAAVVAAMVQGRPSPIAVRDFRVGRRSADPARA